MAIVVQPYGKLNREGAAKLYCKLEKLSSVSSQTHSTWIVDMGNVCQIDRSGLIALVGLQRSAQLSGVRLRLRNVPKAVRAMFEIACLDSQFEFDGQAATAPRALQGVASRP